MAEVTHSLHNINEISSENSQYIDSESSNDDLCTINIPVSNSDILLHPYNIYPAIEISESVFKKDDDDDMDIANDAKHLYVNLCKSNKSIPVKKIMIQLSTNSINLAYAPLNTKDIKSLCGSLFKNTTVRSVNLSKNYLFPEACFYIGILLSVNSNIEYLNLASCKIGTEGLKQLNKGLMKNKTLKELIMSHNHIDDLGLEVLSTTMISSSIEKYDLSNNLLKNIKILSNVFKKDVITTIDISRNQLDEKGLQLLLKTLKNNKSLLFLNLSWNGLRGDLLGLPLKMLITKNKTLQYLDISNNRLCTALITMSSGFKMIKSLKILKIDNNPVDPMKACEILKNLGTKITTLKTIDMKNICVNKEFVNLLDTINKRRGDNGIAITHGYIIGNYEITDVDMREILLKRAKSLGNMKKKYKRNFRKYILNLPKEFLTDPTVNELEKSMKRRKLVLDAILMREICIAFQSKRVNFVNMEEIKSYALKLWPE